MGTKYTPPSMLEVVRMNLVQAENAIKNKDVGTAQRCVDAAEGLFKNLRGVLRAQGLDVGPSVWATTPDLPADYVTELAPPIPELIEAQAAWRDRTERSEKYVPITTEPAEFDVALEPDLPGTAPVTRVEMEAAITHAMVRVSQCLPPPPRTPPLPSVEVQLLWVTDLAQRRWRGGVAWGLAWALVRCLAALTWRGMRRMGGGR